MRGGLATWLLARGPGKVAVTDDERDAVRLEVEQGLLKLSVRHPDELAVLVGRVAQNVADVAPSIKNSQMASPQNCRPDATQTQRSANATQRERVPGRDSARDTTQRERNAA